jgi:hypothetical protein
VKAASVGAVGGLALKFDSRVTPFTVALNMGGND